jgi:GNAT superfamily N-acetyltransferase
MDDLKIQPLSGSCFSEAVRLLGFLNPDAPPRVLEERLRSLLDDHPHYRIIGAFQGERLIGVCGAWTATKMWCGRYLEIDNLVVDPDHRSCGAGTRMIEHLVEAGRAAGCIANHPSHRLYHRLGFEIWGFHFVKPVGDWAGTDGA